MLIVFVTLPLQFLSQTWNMYCSALAQAEPERAAPLEVDPEPFRYQPQPASNHYTEMVDGVVRVWPDAQARLVAQAITVLSSAW